MTSLTLVGASARDRSVGVTVRVIDGVDVTVRGVASVLADRRSPAGTVDGASLELRKTVLHLHVGGEVLASSFGLFGLERLGSDGSAGSIAAVWVVRLAVVEGLDGQVGPAGLLDGTVLKSSVGETRQRFAGFRNLIAVGSANNDVVIVAVLANVNSGLLLDGHTPEGALECSLRVRLGTFTACRAGVDDRVTLEEDVEGKASSSFQAFSGAHVGIVRRVRDIAQVCRSADRSLKILESPLPSIGSGSVLSGIKVGVVIKECNICVGGGGVGVW